MSTIGHVTQLSVNHDVEYHVAVIMPNGKRQDWLLPARDAVSAEFRASKHKQLLPRVKDEAVLHSPLWRKLLRRIKD